ncbi:MAG: hypothetical protein AAGC70_16335 [Pseudomonadota bacterium]
MRFEQWAQNGKTLATETLCQKTHLDWRAAQSMKEEYANRATWQKKVWCHQVFYLLNAHADLTFSAHILVSAYYFAVTVWQIDRDARRALRDGRDARIERFANRSTAHLQSWP